jgi:YVTN family beta-propeller protein
VGNARKEGEGVYRLNMAAPIRTGCVRISLACLCLVMAMPAFPAAAGIPHAVAPSIVAMNLSPDIGFRAVASAKSTADAVQPAALAQVDVSPRSVQPPPAYIPRLGPAGLGPSGLPGSPNLTAAPIGITDYGVTPTNTDYSYITTNFTGSILITNLSTSGDGNNSSLQLNVVLPINGTSPIQIPPLPGGSCPTGYIRAGGECDQLVQYVYWIQDVVEVDASQSNNSLHLAFADNIWNLSGGNMSGGLPWSQYPTSSTVQGNGSITNGCGLGSCKPLPAYYEETAPDYHSGTRIQQGYGWVTLPVWINLSVAESVITTYVPNGTGPPIIQIRPHVQFSYSVNWSNLGTEKWFSYDNVSFIFANDSLPGWNTSGFAVAGGRQSDNLWWDAELDFAGDGSGRDTRLLNGTLRFTLNYTSNGQVLPVPNAWNYGSDTAESATNVNGSWPAGQVFTGSGPYYAILTNGSEQLQFLRASGVGTGLSISPNLAIVNSNETAHGSGFGSNFGVKFWIWNPSGPITGATSLTQGDCRTSSAGTFAQCWFLVSPEPNATYEVMASDGLHTDASPIAISPEMVLSETSGKAGAPVNVYATGLPGKDRVHVGFCPALRNPNYGYLDPYYSCATSWFQMNYTFINSTNGSFTWHSHIPSSASNGTAFVALNNSNSSGLDGALSLFQVPSPVLTISVSSYANLTTFPNTLVGNNWTIFANGSGFKPYSPIYFAASTNYSYSAHPRVTVLGKCQALASGSFEDCRLNVTVWYSNSPLVPPVPNPYSITLSAHDNQWSIGSPTTGTTGSVGVGSGPGGIAYNSKTGYLFVTNYNSGTVTVVSNSTLSPVATISVGSCPSGIAYDSAKNEIVVADSCGNSLSIIDATSFAVLTTMTLSSNPMSIAYDRANGEFFVVDSGSGNRPLIPGSGSGTVSVINDTTLQVVATISVGTNPAGVAFDEDTGDAYVSNQGSNSISVISATTNTVTGTVTVGSSPSAVAVDYGANELAVANTAAGTVSVINASTLAIVGTVNVGPSPGGVGYDPLDGLLIVTSTSNNSVYAINDTTLHVVSTIAVGTGPSGIIWSNGIIWAANSGTSSISYSQWLYTATATISVRIP